MQRATGRCCIIDLDRGPLLAFQRVACGAAEVVVVEARPRISLARRDARALELNESKRVRTDSCAPLRTFLVWTDYPNAAGAQPTRLCWPRVLLVLALLAASIASEGHAQRPPHALTTLPVGDAAYAQLAALDRIGCDAARVSPHRPFLVRDVQRAVRQFAGEPRCSGPIAASLHARFIAPPRAELPADVAPDLAEAVRESDSDTLDVFRVGGRVTLQGTALSRGEFEPLWAGVRPRSEGTPPAVLDARARVGWSASPRLAIVGELYAQTSRRNDPTVRQRALRNTSGIVDFGESYANASLGRLDVSFGRGWAAWLGDSTESLALSANGPLMDRLEIGIRWRVAEVRALVAAVNDVTMTAALDSLATGTPDTRFHRWLYGHVLTVKPTTHLELTLGETILSSRTSRGLDLAYANPLMAYLITQNDTGRVASDRRDNLVVSGGARARIGPGNVGAELVVDDVQIDAADRQKTADQLAWRLYASAPIGIGTATNATAEFARVDSYTYMRDFYTDVYQQYDKPLGSVLGPGADRLQLSAESWLGGETRVSASVGRWRQGGLRIFQRPSAGPNGNADRPFPATTDQRPAAQSALLASIGAERFMLRFPVAVQLEAARIRNASNVPGAAALYVRAILRASYAFRYP